MSCLTPADTESIRPTFEYPPDIDKSGSSREATDIMTTAVVTFDGNDDVANFSTSDTDGNSSVDGRAQEHFQKSAVIVENALLATRRLSTTKAKLFEGSSALENRNSGADRRHPGRGRPVAASSGKQFKSFAALGRAVIGQSNEPGLGSTGLGRRLQQAGVMGSVGLLRDDDESNRSIDTTRTYQVLKPFFICMKLFGIFFVRSMSSPSANQIADEFNLPTGSGISRSTSSHRGCLQMLRRRCKISFLQVYGALMTSLLFVNFVRSLASLENTGKLDFKFAFKLVWITYWYEAFTRALCAQWFWTRKATGSWRHVFVLFDTRFYVDAIVPYEAVLQKTMYCLIAVSGFTAVLIMSLFTYGLFNYDVELNDVYNAALLPHDVITTKDLDAYWSTYVVKVLVIITAGWSTFVSSLFLGFFVLICQVLYKEFEYLARIFEMKITPDGDFTDDIERCRLTHQQRCRMVDMINEHFKYFVANTYIAEVVAECMLMYSMLNPSMPQKAKTHGILWLLFLGIQTIVMSLYAISVNTQAHSILSSIYNIQANNARKDYQLEIEMFLNKLTRTSIGLTAVDLFVVIKPALLTIIGIILGLFFLMMQIYNPLQPPLPDIKCSCTTFENSTNEYFHSSSAPTTSLTPENAI